MIAEYLSAVGITPPPMPEWALCDPRLNEWDRYVIAVASEHVTARVALVTVNEIAARLGRRGQEVELVSSAVVRLMRLGILVPLMRGGFVVNVGPITSWREQTFAEWCAEELAELPARHERMRLAFSGGGQ